MLSAATFSWIYPRRKPQPMPDLRLIAPPATDETSCVLAENGIRQTWHRTRLDAHQLDYFCHENLWPGWCCWHHNGRYVSDATLRYLATQMWPGAQPLL